MRGRGPAVRAGSGAARRNRLLTAVAVAAPLALAAACGTGTAGPPTGGTSSGGTSSGGAGHPGAAAVLAGTPGGAPPGHGIPAGPAPGPQSLSETGSTLLYPLLRAWAAAYHRQYPNVSITTAATGSGKGIAGASAGAVTIGASDAFLSSGDLVTNPALLNVPLAISAQQVDYHVPGVPARTHLRLTGQVLAQMYEGKITAWNDPAIASLNPRVRLPATRVVPVHRSDSSGDTFLFTSYVSTHDPAWNRTIGYGTTVAWPSVPGARAEHGNTGMVAGCRATPGCVAYVGISYLTSALAGGLGEAQLANTLGQYELPTAATMTAAVNSFVSSIPPNETISMVDGPAPGGYPIVNYEYAIVSTRQPGAARARDVKAFLHWAITAGNAARFLTQVRFQPLPAPVVSLSDEQIAKIGQS